MLVRGRDIGIGAGHIDILGDRGIREDSPQRAQSPRRKTCLVLCLRGLCASVVILFGCGSAVLRYVVCHGRPLRLQVAQEALE